eukprot:15969741-Heterocapsa_arctica.AAC.1
MATKVKGAKLYKRELPKDCARFLVEYGNLVNNEATGTTFLQVVRSTSLVEPAWARAKQAMQWTASSIGQGKLNDKKFEFAASMFPMRWLTYTSYERCSNFLKDCRGKRKQHKCLYESQKTKIEVGEFKGMTVWDALHKRFKEEVAVSQMAASSMESVMHIAYDVCRILKANHPEYIPILVLMAMPRSDKPWGSCSLLPGGLPVVKGISIDKINQLLQEMSESTAVAEVLKSGEEQVQVVVVKKRKKSVERGPPPGRGGRGRGALKRGRGESGSLASSSQALTNDDDDKEKEDQDKVQEESQKTFLAYLSSCCDFMVDHIDDRQKARVEAFRVIALYGLLHGEVKLMTSNGVERPIKGLAALRKAFKTELYKFAKLVPRPSDVDFDLDG